MKKNDLYKKDSSICRVLDTDSIDEKIFVIDCIKRSMPVWKKKDFLDDWERCSESTLHEATNYTLLSVENIPKNDKKKMYERFTLVADILPYVTNKKQRNGLIKDISENKGISKQTIRHYLCLYLVYQDISVFMPKPNHEKELSEHEKNIRYGLNKFYYTKNKNSLRTAYTMMLKEKYCDVEGQLLPEYPSYNQFVYFYQKTKKMQTVFISRNGMTDYQRNHRPLLGDGVQEYASHVGIAMFDSTICDIYLVDDSGQLIGRPNLVAACDAYSGICIGYFLCWEGGVYSLRGLLLNIIADKVEHCKKYGINIDRKEWDCNQLPTKMITDKGSEYDSYTFEQIAELGIEMVALPAYRPELKGVIEKFFDCVQGYFQPYLKGKGLIEPDYQERGARDYRKDACLTLLDFEKVLIRCIIYYNTKRLLENYPYSVTMLSEKIQPFAINIWEYGKSQPEATLIDVAANDLILTLLPRVCGRFTRYGLKVNGMRYHSEGYTEQYLTGGEVVCAYNPDDVAEIWIMDKGKYIRFELIESRFAEKTLSEVEHMLSEQKAMVKNSEKINLQAKIDLQSHIEAITASKYSDGNVNLKGIRKTREKAKNSSHIDYVKEGGISV